MLFASGRPAFGMHVRSYMRLVRRFVASARAGLHARHARPPSQTERCARFCPAPGLVSQCCGLFVRSAQISLHLLLCGLRHAWKHMPRSTLSLHARLWYSYLWHPTQQAALANTAARDGMHACPTSGLNPGAEKVDAVSGSKASISDVGRGDSSRRSQVSPPAPRQLHVL